MAFVTNSFACLLLVGPRQLSFALENVLLPPVPVYTPSLIFRKPVVTFIRILDPCQAAAWLRPCPGVCDIRKHNNSMTIIFASAPHLHSLLRSTQCGSMIPKVCRPRGLIFHRARILCGWGISRLPSLSLDIYSPSNSLGGGSQEMAEASSSWY